MADEDEYNPDALDDEGGQDEDHQYEPTKERIIALIDADRRMLDTLTEEDEERSYVSWAVSMVAGIMQDRIRLSPRDEFGIVFYGTVEKSEGRDRSFEHVFEYLPLEVPAARTIRRLAAFDGAEFEASPGSCDAAASPGQAADDLRSGLWACWDMFVRSAGTTSSHNTQHSRVSKTVLLFTNNPNPLAPLAAAAAAGGAAAEALENAKEKLDIRAQELGSLSTHIEVIPLIQLSDPAAFDMAPFWRPLLGEARAMAASLAGGSAGEAEASDELAELEEAGDDIEAKVLRVKGLGLRSASGRKRPLNAVHWTLGPAGGFKIAVKLYGLLMPAKKPHHTYVTAAANDEVLKERALIDLDTGSMLSEVKYRAFELDAKGGGERFPKIVLRGDEVSALKALRPKGLTLLGFKPVACLQDYHTLGASRFVYPDERSLRGSTAAFVALHAACLADEDNLQMPVCSYVARPGLAPQLVALLPQQEELDGDIQVTPPGFHMITLPFKDDLRSPETDPSLVSRVTAGQTAPPRANADQVAAAVALLDALSIDTTDEEGQVVPFSSDEIANAALERHFQVLEALALGEAVPDKDELEDDTEPDVVGMSRHSNTLDAFKLAVFGSADGPPAKAAKPSAKRKAEDPAMKKAVAEEYAEHDWPTLAASDANPGLGSLTISGLKVYLQHHGLKLTGNKAQLIERITEHVASRAGG